MTALTTDRRGGTTEHRAIFSTVRREHLRGADSGRYRCHLILGDRHRSHFSIALQLGATNLVLRAVEELPHRIQPLWKVGMDQSRFWLEAARRFNLLARGGRIPEVDPLALDIQRFYLDLAAEFVDGMTDRPNWAERLLADWCAGLCRLRDGDQSWLAVPLDPWIKRRLLTAWLKDRGIGWDGIRPQPDLLNRLALLDQAYHRFTTPANLFDWLEAAGLLEHRVGPLTAPGAEAEPFVPDVLTRAKARARFIRDHAGAREWTMDWPGAVNRTTGQVRLLIDPFATHYDS
jgi:hypothetical protein